jgi:hypothetical protein
VVLWLVIFVASLVLDYAKVIAVRQGEGGGVTSVPGALLAAVRMVFGHPLKTGGLYMCTGLLWLAVLLLYAAVVPGTGVSSAWAIVATFVLGQLYLLSRVGLRCVFYAGEAVMCAALAERTTQKTEPSAGMTQAGGGI